MRLSSVVLLIALLALGCSAVTFAAGVAHAGTIAAVVALACMGYGLAAANETSRRFYH
jgi:hypothetical protein